MSDEQENSVPALPAPRRRNSFLRNKYARVLNIREFHPDRATARVTLVPATLDASRARMLIVVTKLIDQVEKKLNLMEDGSVIMVGKEYKEMIETLERAQKIMNDAFGLSTAALKAPAQPIPVNNGVIINGASAPNMDKMMQAVTAAAVRKTVQEQPPIDDTGSNSGSA